MLKIIQNYKLKKQLQQIERKILHYNSKIYYMSVTNCNCVEIINTLYLKQFYMLARTNILKQL